MTDPERSAAKPDLPPTPRAPEKLRESWETGFMFQVLTGLGLYRQKPLRSALKPLFHLQDMLLLFTTLETLVRHRGVTI